MYSCCSAISGAALFSTRANGLKAGMGNTNANSHKVRFLPGGNRRAEEGKARHLQTSSELWLHSNEIHSIADIQT